MIKNIEKLHSLLVAAGIPFDGVDATGKVSFKPEATLAHQTAANRIISTFVDTPSYLELRNGPNGYFPLQTQIKMLASDIKNGTTTLLNHIADVETRFPVDM